MRTSSAVRLGRVHSRVRRFGVIATLGIAAAAVLTGCVDDPNPMPTPTETEPSATPTPTPTPEIQLEGTAGQNQAYFDMVNRRLIDAGGTLDGRAFIDNLVAAGYPKTEMEVTPDRTAIGGAADSVQFSIRINGTCLLGQYGPDIGYASDAAPLLGTGKCLVGATRPIDW